ncbi:endo alpha-1,4 polygalactosaminidase [Millisia brevis]|uniref:endo alpha-1,4 polygalactosaminidase n=1 Tax=Millisia brevis TaxID=264148 RepID=UPI000A7F17C6|nr:endo alpha-1,4 polygalactosaminidase [Millisia brevis]
MRAWLAIAGLALLVPVATACGPAAEESPGDGATPTVAATGAGPTAAATGATPPASAGDTVTGPPTGVGFDYQLGGDYPVPADVGVVVRQWDSAPAPGVYSVCYVNAFQTEAQADGPGGAERWPDGLVLDITDPEWPGEHPIDIGTPAHRDAAAAFVSDMLAACAERGFDAVEFDNLDSYQRYPDLPSDRDDTIAYARLLVDAATRSGLAAGQKNTPDLLDAAPDIGFSFAIAEECGQFDECESYVDRYGDAVFDVEYTRDGLDAACAAIGERAAVIQRDLDLVPGDSPGYLRRVC